MLVKSPVLKSQLMRFGLVFAFFGNISFLVSVACVSMVCCCNLARITLHFAFNFETSFLKVSVVLLALGET